MNHDGSRLMSAQRPGRVFVWDTKTGEMFEGIAAATEGVTAAAFSHDGETLATASGPRESGSPDGEAVASPSPGSLTLWSAESGREIRSLPAPDDWVIRVGFSGDDHRLLTVAGDSVRVYDVQTGRVVVTLGPYKSLVRHAAISHDGTTVVISAREGVLEVWRPVTPAAGETDPTAQASAR